MKKQNRILCALSIAVFAAAVLVVNSAAAEVPAPLTKPDGKPADQTKKLKVFILMGHAEIGTFDYIGDDPATAPILQEMRDADGQPRVCDEVCITSVG